MSKEDKAWTRLQLIEWTADFLRQKGIEGARLDAEVLLGHILGTTRLDLYVHHDQPVSSQALAGYREVVARRAKREPLKYILGYTEFLSFGLAVDGRVLIPRPETELLAEGAIALLRRELPPGRKTVVDVGTGSGCLAVAIAKNLPDVLVHATDTSADALEVARTNAHELGVQDQVVFHQGALLEPVAELAGQVHLVVSNPPYVSEAEQETLEPELHYEPLHAIVAGPTGLEVITPLVAAAPELLSDGGVLLLEIGAGQATEVRELLQANSNYESYAFHRDYADIERIVEARRASRSSGRATRMSRTT